MKTRVLRAYTENALELAIATYIGKREDKGETWVQSSDIEYHPARAILYKPYSVELMQVA